MRLHKGDDEKFKAEKTKDILSSVVLTPEIPASREHEREAGLCLLSLFVINDLAWRRIRGSRAIYIVNASRSHTPIPEHCLLRARAASAEKSNGNNRMLTVSIWRIRKLLDDDVESIIDVRKYVWLACLLARLLLEIRAISYTRRSHCVFLKEPV